jgi:hypothetical protein
MDSLLIGGSYGRNDLRATHPEGLRFKSWPRYQNQIKGLRETVAPFLFGL